MYRDIVFAYDGSAESQDMLDEGITLALQFTARSRLVAVVAPWSPMALAAGP